MMKMKKLTANVRKAMLDNYEGMIQIFGLNDERTRGAKAMLSYIMDAHDLHVFENKAVLERAFRDKFMNPTEAVDALVWLDKMFIKLTGRAWNFDWTLSGLDDMAEELGYMKMYKDADTVNKMLGVVNHARSEMRPVGHALLV
jgi:hypothetical protein